MRLNGCYPDTVIGGFHLYNPVRDTYESPEIVLKIAEFLLQTKANFTPVTVPASNLISA